MLAGLSLGLGAPAVAATPPAAEDIRRDATVTAVERVMPAVVNINTEEVVAIRDPFENIFRDFFGPYYQRRQPNTQYSLGSGVVIDEEGYVLTNFHVVGRARRVFDVAGGMGKLNEALTAQGAQVVTFDRRHRHLSVPYFERVFTLDEPCDADLVVGLHPDGATRVIIEYAALHRIFMSIASSRRPHCACWSIIAARTWATPSARKYSHAI